MSMTQEVKTAQCENKNCSTRGNRRTFIEDSYCSQTCKWEADGREFLSEFKYDHTHCFTCGTKLKEVSRPDDAEIRAFSKDPKSGWILEAFVGFQDTTEYADYGEKDFGTSTGTGIVCGVCGNTTHSAHIEELSTEGMLEHVQLFLDGLDTYTEESFDQTEVLYGILDGDSIELAVGRALYE